MPAVARPSLLLAAWLAVACCPAQAQLRLPGGGGGLGLPGLPRPIDDAQERLRRNAAERTAGLIEPAAGRLAQATDLLRRHPQRLERDPRGELVVSGELLWLGASDAALAAARQIGFCVSREHALTSIASERVLVMAPPAGRSLAEALALLQALQADAVVEWNHVYLQSASTTPRAAPAPVAAAGGAPPSGTAPVPIGLIDGGIDTRHPALTDAAIRRQGCGGSDHPSAHGTAVASLLVGRAAAFAGAAPGAQLRAVDVYCGEPTGGNALALAVALDGLAADAVPVINLSLVGPANRLLERSVARLVERGHLLVASVGNDGPAAPPVYPAAYPGVVGVTGVDPRRRVLPEAGRGPQLMFAAPGSELAVARAGSEAGYAEARGTSFAAPLVAGLLAQRLTRPDREAAARAVQALVREAIDLGERGRDAVYGEGLVGEALRSEPRRLGAAGQPLAAR